MLDENLFDESNFYENGDNVMYDLGFIYERVLGEITKSIPFLRYSVFENKEEFLNTSLQYSLLLSDFKSELPDLIQELSRIEEFIMQPSARSGTHRIIDDFFGNLTNYSPLEGRIIEMYFDFCAFFNNPENFINYLLRFDGDAGTSSFNYFYSPIDRLVLLDKTSDTLLFDFLRGILEHVQFYYPLFEDHLPTEHLQNLSETEKDDFFSWVLIHLNQTFDSERLRTTSLRFQKEELENFLKKGESANHILNTFKTQLVYNAKLYEKYNILSMMKFGLEVSQDNADYLLEYLLKEEPLLKKLNVNNIGARVIFKDMPTQVKYLLVDYSNSCKESMFFDDFYSVYLLPRKKFKEYVNHGDLFVNSFLWQSKYRKTQNLRDPFEDEKVIYSEKDIDEIIKFNRHSLKRFERFFRENNIDVSYVENELIQPYYSILMETRWKLETYSNKDNLKRLLTLYHQFEGNL